MERRDVIEPGCDGGGDLGCRVRARVVGDGDLPGEGQLSGQETVKAIDRGGERALFVVDRNDDLDV
jgi:hypothetical protein